MFQRLTGIMLLLIFTAAAELPFYSVVPDLLNEGELQLLQELTETTPGVKLWYGRTNFWRETFWTGGFYANKSCVFIHEKVTPYASVMDRIAQLFLTKLNELGVDLSQRRIFLETYLDRNSVLPENAAGSGLFWHRDSMMVMGEKKVADYSVVLLLSHEEAWSGADLILQSGGNYKPGTYEWVHSEALLITIKPVYNQAVLFRNFDAGHHVTALLPLANLPIDRDVLITTCFLEER